MQDRIQDLRDRLEAPDQADTVSARDAVRALSIPRATGTEGAARVERWLRLRFERLGYETRILPFEFSTVPGRWGITVLAATLVVGVLASAGMLVAGRPLAALAALAVPAVAAASAVRGSSGWIYSLRWGREEGRNLAFTRPGARVRYLFAAHRDSKSQPTSTAARLSAGSVTAVAGAVLGLFVIHGTLRVLAGVLGGWAESRIPALLLDSAGEIFGPLLALEVPPVLVVAVAAVAAAGGVVLALAWAGNESPGALDNATGVAALLRLAERLAHRDDVGFLITDAEELGLAGARAVASEITSALGVFNLDGLDDDGPIHVIERYGFPRRGRAPHMAATLMATADGLDLDIERHDAPLGILLEHSAYSDAGVPSLTLLRGRRGALRRVHRPADRPEHIAGRGVASVVALLEGTLHLLDAGRAAPPPPLLPGRAHPSGQDLRPEPGVERTPLFAHRPVAEPLPPDDEDDDTPYPPIAGR